jgi:hypothetical protein
MNASDVTAQVQPPHLFKPGQSGNPAGRPRGSRNRLADAFVTDLMECWEKNGKTALERCAVTEPATFVKVIASLMPRDINLSVGLDVATFAQSFEQALSVLGVEQPPERPLLPGQKRVIDGSHR